MNTVQDSLNLSKISIVFVMASLPHNTEVPFVPKKEFTDISTDESGARELISFILYLFEADRPVPQTTLQRIFVQKSPTKPLEKN